MREYAEIVAEDIRGEDLDEDENDLLVNDMMRWKDAVTSVMRDIDAQIAIRKAKIADESDQAMFAAWRSGALRFKKSTQDRLVEIRAIMRESGLDENSKGRNDYLKMILEEVQAMRKLMESR